MKLSMFSEGYPQDHQVSYAATLWLIVAQLVVMAPLVFFLPVWLLPVLLFSAVWRIRVMKGYQTQPSKIIKLVLVAVGIAGLFTSGMETVSLDMMASLLMLAFSYKVLEIVQKRDALVVILTGFVLIAVLFLYSQEFAIALYGVFALTVLTGAMIAVQQSISHSILPNLRLASLMLFLCLPLMIIFFIFSPRLAPLWTVPLAGGHAQSGITDSMTPGDIANLSQSADLAFTVKFTDQETVPSQRDLYWRGLTMNYFDGKTWTQFEKKLDADSARTELKVEKSEILNHLLKKGELRKYEIIYERTAQPWLFALASVVDVKGDAIYGSDFRVMANRDILDPTLFKFTSNPEAMRELSLSDEHKKLALQLPENENPNTRALAQKLRAASSSNIEYINKVLNRYRQETFHYTLRPPTLSNRNNIDQFLLETKKGFCAHYSGSFVFMMRAVGIPARVVTGYQGGEWNAKGQFLSIRQYDAHAWTEVWLENRGWLRFDPTSMVAPDRIEKNLAAAVSREGSFLEGQFFSMSKYSWLKSLQSKLESSQYAWRRFVLAYDSETQTAFLKDIFGEMTVRKTAMIVGGFFAGIILLWVITLRLGRKGVAEAQEHQIYRKFCLALENNGVARELSQEPVAFSQVAIKQYPNLVVEINQFTRLYSDICYKPSFNKQNIDTLKGLLKTIKKKLSKT